MPRDGAATRARILAAAIDEFSEHGFAGARVDRVARTAAANKRAIYDYFADKEGLFTAALHQVMEELVAAVPLTEDDLPGYAGRMFDYHLAHPRALRMHLWRQLERPGVGPEAADMYAEKVAAMRRGPGDGDAGPISPTDRLVLVAALANGWMLSPEDLLAADGSDPHDPERLRQHRAAVVEAARRLAVP